MTKETKIKAIIIIALAALTGIYIWLDEFIAISWLAFYYLILPISGLYIIKSYLNYRKKALHNKQKQEALEREKILEEKRKKEKLERLRVIEEQKKQKELDRIHLRDSELQEMPYIYESGTHANEALAIRYGIANPEFKVQLRKIKKLKDSHYKVELTDFRNRHAVAVIETGTEYVKTFMPINDSDWFEKHKDLELTLKGNGSFSLKELATFHVQKTINS